MAPDGRLNLAQTALAATLALVPAQGPRIDLSEILAPAPTAAYSAVNDSNTINGPFSSVYYSTWEAESNIDTLSNWDEFDRNGFKRGYARSWVWLSDSKAQEGFSRRNYLIETVEEYSSDAGARWRFDHVVKTTRGPDGSLVREIDTSSISGAFGAVQLNNSYFFVMFARGNDVYIVRMETEIDDLTTAVVTQAQKQSFLAPPFTIPPAQWSTGQPASTPTSSGFISIPVALLILAITAILTAAVIFGRRRRASS
jgi:hypothetical protein